MKICDLKVKKGKSMILKIPNAKINVSKGTAIFGENGAGKTTLMKCILGIEQYGGTIENSLSKNQIQVLMQKKQLSTLCKDERHFKVNFG